jgi:hypothetical protein
VDDFDEELFYNKSSIVPEYEKIMEASTRFGTTTAAQLENVRRGGERWS